MVAIIKKGFRSTFTGVVCEDEKAAQVWLRINKSTQIKHYTTIPVSYITINTIQKAAYKKSKNFSKNY